MIARHAARLVAVPQAAGVDARGHYLLAERLPARPPADRAVTLRASARPARLARRAVTARRGVSVRFRPRAPAGSTLRLRDESTRRRADAPIGMTR